jgi:GAF domain-containing protein
VEEVIEGTRQNIEHIAEDLNITFLNPSREETVDQSPEIFRLHREMERKDRQLAMVNEISAFVTENPRPEELIQVVVEAIHRGIGFNRTLLFLVNTAENTLCGRLGLGYDVPPFLRSVKVPVESDGLMGRAVCEKRTFNIVDTQSPSHDHLPCVEIPSLAKISTFALVPFVAGTEVLGLIMVDNMVTREAIRDEEVNLIRTFLSMAGVYLAGYAKK